MLKPHPEEARSAVSKDEVARRAGLEPIKLEMLYPGRAARNR